MSARGRRAAAAVVGEVGEAVEQRAPQVGDLDPLLLVGSACSVVLAQVAAEHTIPTGAVRCLSCGWVIGGGQRVCPSRALARCVKDRRPVPAWLVHLVGVVPGAVAPRVTVSPDERAAAEDALPGQFDAPPRVEPDQPDCATPPGGHRGRRGGRR